LIALVGALVGILNIYSLSAFSYIFAGAFFLLICSYYVVDSLLKKATGLTTEFAALLVFMIGFLVITEIIPLQLVIAITVILSFLMSYKEKIENFAGRVPRNELEALLSFGIMSLVILPFLPNKTFYLGDIPSLVHVLSTYGVRVINLMHFDILNPFKLWLVVVLITGLDVIGYIVSKLIGKKRGLILTSMVSGFVSSTSSTIAISEKSKGHVKLNIFVASIVLANLTSFIHMFVLVAPINPSWLLSLTPTLILLLLSSLVVFFFYYIGNNKNEEKHEIEQNEKIFSFIWAFRFAMSLILIRIVTKIALICFGQGGFIASSSVASLIGMDAVVINLAEMFGKFFTAKGTLLIFLIVNSVNLFSKVIYGYIYGSKILAFKLLIAMGTIILFSWIGYIFMK